MSDEETRVAAVEAADPAAAGAEAGDRARAGRRRRARWISALAAVVVVAVVAVVLLAGGASDANGAEDGDAVAEEEAAVPVEVVTATRETVSAYISATANLVAENDVTVLAESEGRVTSLAVDEGRVVRRGEVLARLDPSDEEIALKKAQLRDANAQLAYERGRDLFERELISREENDRVTVEHQIARQELAESEWALAQTVIKAPFGGRVTARHIQLGQHVRLGDPLFQITDFDPLIARIYLSEGDVVGLAPGTEATIRLNAGPQIELRGRIRQISPVVDTATGTVKVTVEATEPSGDVRPGSFVSIHVVREERPNALVVPREAILRELQSTHVFTVGGEDGETVTKRAVSLGIEDAGRVEVIAGLEAGARVVIAGQGSLEDGARVRVLDAADATAGEPEPAAATAP
ncbi:MAG: efflux RND transporter periplasmic adaptor subunit [Acidobacteriota bacterium]|nr:efflux RND transporter periplasmic adaptor subunit [Acidobacteriota bacterium]